MPLLVPETLVTRRIFVAAELGPHGVIDQFGQVVCDLDIGPETKEYIARLANVVLLTPNLASQKFAMAPTQSSSGMRFLR